MCDERASDCRPMEDPRAEDVRSVLAVLDRGAALSNKSNSPSLFRVSFTLGRPGTEAPLCIVYCWAID